MLEADQNPPQNTTVYLKDYTPPDFLIPQVRLEFELSDEVANIRAILSVQRNGAHTRPLVLDGEQLRLVAVTLEQKKLAESDYNLDERSLTLPQVPDQFELIIDTQMQPKANTQLSGLYQSSGNFCTQCEAEGFRRISYFLDRPDVLSVYQVRLSANRAACPVLLSNGNLSAQGDNADGSHWAEWHDPHPKPSYLFALVAGDLQHISDQYQTTSGRQVTLNIYTQAHNIDQCQHAMDSLKNAMQWDEQVYGREYDLDIYNVVAVDDFNMGAMENKGLNIFNSKYVLADQQSATDTDYEGIESVIGHEYFHNWSGNRVTCRDWFQLSLKEGFTVFRDQEFSADQGSRAVKRIRDVQTLRAYQFKEDAGPMAHPIRPESYQEINNFYTVTVYEKGAEVIRMLHRMLGAEGFRKGSDLYFARHDGQAVTTEDFIQSMEQANDIDLGQFRLWYSQAGTPKLTVEQHQQGSTLTLKISQQVPPTPGQNRKQPMLMPISTAVFARDGKKLLEQTLMLNQAEQEFHLEPPQLPGDQPPLVSLLRDFSAPVKFDFAQIDDDLARLVEIDDNGFARWEAMQRLYINLLLPYIKTGQRSEASYQRVLSCLRSLLTQPEDDPAMVAEMLSLPSHNYLAELLDEIDPSAIFNARRELQRSLAHACQAELQQVYQANHADHTEPFSLSAMAMAQRALKNSALAYLVAGDTQESYQLAERQYKTANNMTDRLAAFSALVHSEYAAKQDLLEDFYQNWQHNTLVLDKWFAIQAMAPRKDTLSQVKRLMAHPAFDLKNPNKVRSLIGAFAANQASFHAGDGQGYEFIADQTIALNSTNPQIAARLVGVFNSHKKYQAAFAQRMQQQLQRINAQRDLSKDVREIVSKALQQE